MFAAIGITIYDKISLTGLIKKMFEPLTFMVLIHIIGGALIYISLVLSLIYAIRIITVKRTGNFNISVINFDLISSAKIDSVRELVETYLDLIHRHRANNGVIAKWLTISQCFMIISIVLISIYLAIK